MGGKGISEILTLNQINLILKSKGYNRKKRREYIKKNGKNKLNPFIDSNGNELII
jgi:hypothetical protein